MTVLHRLLAILETRGLAISWTGLAIGLALCFAVEPATAHWLALEDQLLQSIQMGLYLAAFVLLVQLNRYAARSVWVLAGLLALLYLRELDYQQKFNWLGMLHDDTDVYEPILKPGPSDAVASVLIVAFVALFLAYAAWAWGRRFLEALRARDTVALTVASGLACLAAARPVDNIAVWAGRVGFAAKERLQNRANYFEEVLELGIPWFFCQAALLALLRAATPLKRASP